MKSILPHIKCLLLLIAFSNLAHAFYDPGQGRWLSRDPIEEEGGANLYAFVGNDGVKNSNTFARALLEKCGCKLKSYIYGNWDLFPFPYYNTGETAVPWGARGWQTKPPNYWPMH